MSDVEKKAAQGSEFTGMVTGKLGFLFWPHDFIDLLLQAIMTFRVHWWQAVPWPSFSVGLCSLPCSVFWFYDQIYSQRCYNEITLCHVQ